MAESLDTVFIAFQSALAGRYSLERELGRGGMGIVYLAREVRLDRLVAIKLLPPDLAVQTPLRERFLREARTAARLSHPNIVPIFAVDDVSDFVFYVMAYVDGETLSRRVSSRGPVPPHDASRILREVAWALAYAHAQGVVHRDIKPDNILLEQGTGRALVTDFGIARLTQAGGTTSAGEVLGTPEFMSPEQASAEPVDGRSDLYSLGVVGYYMLSGKLPFTGQSAGAILTQHLTTPAPLLAPVARGVPSSLCQAIDRCLAKEPAKRYETGEALAEAIGASLETTRDSPVAVRVFLNQIARDQRSLGSGGIILLMFTWPFVATTAAGHYGARGALGILGGYVATMLGIAAITSARTARNLLRSGYGANDAILALRSALQRRREELAFEFGPAIPRIFNRGMKVATALGAASAAILIVNPPGAPLANQPLTRILHGVPAEGAGILGLGLAALIGLISVRRLFERRDMSSEWRTAWWRGRVGRWIFKLAGWRLPHVSVAAVNRPTEMALGSAADALYHELPKATRQALGDVPSVIKSLESRAQHIRDNIAGLDRSIAEAGEADRAPAGHRDALVTDLRGAREQAQLKLGDVVAALEAIRLDLLRLRAGAGSVESITADLTRAREMGEHTERLIAGQREVDGALKA